MINIPGDAATGCNRTANAMPPVEEKPKHLGAGLRMGLGSAATGIAAGVGMAVAAPVAGAAAGAKKAGVAGAVAGGVGGALAGIQRLAGPGGSGL